MKSIFFQALDCPSGAERLAMVGSLCDGDDALAAEVTSLLEWAERELE